MLKFIFSIFYSLVAFTCTSQNAGIGVANPVHGRLEINGTVGAAVAMFGIGQYGTTIEADNPEIGFNYYYNNGTKTIKAGYAAYFGMFPSNGALYIGNFNGNVSSSDFGDISGAQEAMSILQNGCVGIGTSTPGYPLTVKSVFSGAGLIQESTDGNTQVGFWTFSTGAYVQTWTNTDLNFTTGNGVSKMVLKTSGDLSLNKSLNIGQNLTSPRTGTSNLVPIVMAKIADDGTILKSTGNISVNHTGTGNYDITLLYEANVLLNENKYSIFITPLMNGHAYTCNYAFEPGGIIKVTTGNQKIIYNNVSCGCDIFSSVLGTHSLTDASFDILIYKND